MSAAIRLCRGFVLIIIGALTVNAPGGALPQYTLVDLGELSPNGASVANDINNLGVIVGSARRGDFFVAYQWENGTMRPLEVPQRYQEYSEAEAITDRGQIVGHVRSTTGLERAALWFIQDRAFHDLYPNDPWDSFAHGANSQGTIVGEASLFDPFPFATFRLPVRFLGPTRYGPLFNPPETNGAAMDINENGVVVGWVFREFPRIFDRPFIFSDRMRELPTLPPADPRDARGQALAVNQLGRAVGWSRDATVVDRAVYWPNPDTLVLLEQPPFGGSYAFDINVHGQIVGGGSREFGLGALLWNDGELIYLNSLVPPDSPLRLIEARAINDVGQIVGLAFNARTGNFRSFLLEPSDRDRDGLFDVWESVGIDVDADGVIDLDLPALGANPDKKDVFVEIDAMIDRGPTAAQMAFAVQAFDAAPAEAVNNPDGSAGINLHVLIDDTNVPIFGPTDLQFVDLHLIKSMYFGTAADRADPNGANILKAKALVYHYCVFVDQFATAGTLGIGEMPGNDLIIALGGNWPQRVQDDPTLSEFADMLPGAIFMHELGHNLGLDHGGRDAVAGALDPDQFKPNYRSVMNYKWTLPRNWNYEDWRLDYSRVALPPLDENSLVELFGMGGDSRVFVEAFGPTGANNWFPEGGPADFNANDMIDLPDPNHPLRVDLNRDARNPDSTYRPRFSVLHGREDWSALVFRRGPQWAEAFTYSISRDEDFTPASILSDYVLSGDLTGNCRVDLHDVARFMPSFGCSAPVTFLDGDIDRDGVIDLADARLLLERVGSDCGP